MPEETASGWGPGAHPLIPEPTRLTMSHPGLRLYNFFSFLLLPVHLPQQWSSSHMTLSQPRTYKKKLPQIMWTIPKLGPDPSELGNGSVEL